MLMRHLWRRFKGRVRAFALDRSAKKGAWSFVKEMLLVVVALFIAILVSNAISGQLGLGSMPMPAIGLPLVITAAVMVFVLGWLRRRAKV